MKAIKVRDTVLGSGIPKVCVPVTAKQKEDIFGQARAAADAGAQLVEWRADYFEGLSSPEQVKIILEGVRDRIGQIPLIFTVRTAQEGGMWQGSTEDYVNILQEAAKSPQADLFDVELFRDEAQMQTLIGQLQKAGKRVIASCHHFEGTPGSDVMKTVLEKMEAAGADIRKLAVMPHTSRDVLRLLAVTLDASEQGEAPLITMSMGALGAVSRVCGQVFGSCVTFGTTGDASAPGQLPLDRLAAILKDLKTE